MGQDGTSFHRDPVEVPPEHTALMIIEMVEQRYDPEYRNLRTIEPMPSRKLGLEETGAAASPRPPRSPV
jgi:hypothetical protein